jgi:hypothetical protein
MRVKAMVLESLPVREVLAERFNSEFHIHEEWIEFALRNGFTGLYDFL